MGPIRSFFLYYLGALLRSASLRTIRGPFRSFVYILLHVYGALSNHFLCILYGDPLRSAFVHTTCIRGPLRSVSSLTIGGPPQISFFTYYMRQPSSQFLRLLYGAPLGQFFAYYVGLWGPPDQFLRILYGGSPPPHVSFFAYYMEPPQISFFAHYMEASSGQFLRLLYVEAPLDNFLRLLYRAPLWSVSSLTIWGPAPQINFFASYVGASSDQFLRILYRGPPQVIFFAYKGPSVQFLHILYGPPQINFFASYVGASSDQFLRILYRGPPQVIFFAYRGPSVQFLCILYGAPLRLISLLSMWGPLQISFFAYYIGGLFRSISSRTICGGPLR